MSVPDRSIDPRLLDAAREEFLKNGYDKTSLADICKAAGVTTGALYKRYSGKEDLFCALVADTIRDMEAYVKALEQLDLSSWTDREIYNSFSLPTEMNMEWLRYLYDRREGFQLLAHSASGTRYSNFYHDWTANMNRLEKKFYQEARRRGMATREISDEELHVLTYSVWALYYDPFYFYLTWEQIEKHAENIHRFIDWHRVLGMKEPAAD